MGHDDDIFQSYQKGYEEARALYENDELDEVVQKAEKMLAHGDLPRYRRIRLHLLVAACLEDHIEADELVEKAESQWGLASSFVQDTGEPVSSLSTTVAELTFVIGKDPDSSDALAELRLEIDAVKQHFRSEREEAWAQEEREMELEMEEEREGTDTEIECTGEEEMAPE